METRRIGSLEVSVVGLGCNNFGGRIGEPRTREVIDAALEAGITLFDTADNYGGTLSETFIGRALATKFGGWSAGAGRETGGSAANVRASVEASLRRLDTDRIDLFQMHTPDAETPIAETLGALDQLVREGKVREIGCSNLTSAQLGEADAAVSDGCARFASVQNELSLLEPGDVDDGIPEADRLGLAYLPYFPLASGLLTGKVRRGEPVPEGTRIAGWAADRRDASLTDATFDRLEALDAFARDRGHTLLELAFAWLLAQSPVASVIAGATSAEQVRANVAAGEWRLAEDELIGVPA